MDTSLLVVPADPPTPPQPFYCTQTATFASTISSDPVGRLPFHSRSFSWKNTFEPWLHGVANGRRWDR